MVQPWGPEIHHSSLGFHVEQLGVLGAQVGHGYEGIHGGAIADLRRRFARVWVIRACDQTVRVVMHLMAIAFLVDRPPSANLAVPLDVDLCTDVSQEQLGTFDH